MKKTYSIYWMVNKFTAHKLFTGTKEECEIKQHQLLKSDLPHIFEDELAIIEEVR